MNHEEQIFTISVNTPYISEDITEFIMVTGLSIDQTNRVLRLLSKVGVNNLKEVIILCKMGYLNFENGHVTTINKSPTTYDQPQKYGDEV